MSNSNNRGKPLRNALLKYINTQNNNNANALIRAINNAMNRKRSQNNLAAGRAAAEQASKSLVAAVAAKQAAMVNLSKISQQNYVNRIKSHLGGGNINMSKLNGVNLDKFTNFLNKKYRNTGTVTYKNLNSALANFSKPEEAAAAAVAAVTTNLTSLMNAPVTNPPPPPVNFQPTSLPSGGVKDPFSNGNGNGPIVKEKIGNRNVYSKSTNSENLYIKIDNKYYQVQKRANGQLTNPNMNNPYSWRSNGRTFMKTPKGNFASLLTPRPPNAPRPNSTRSYNPFVN